MKLTTIPLSSLTIEDRSRLDPGDLTTLVKSIKEKGIIQPLAVTPIEKGYRLLAGGRRAAACQAAGLTEVPVRVFDEQLSDLQVLEIELEENLLRKDLTFQESCFLKEKIHNLKVELHSPAQTPGATPWTQQDTADLLEESPYTISADLKLARYIRENPNVAKCKNKADAIRTMHRNEELRIQSYIAQRAEAQPQVETGVLSVVKNYIVRDFFEAARELPERSFDLIELDPPWGVDYTAEAMTSSIDSRFQEIKEEDFPPFLDRTLGECARLLANDRWLLLWFGIKKHYTTVMDLLTKHGFRTYGVPAIWYKPGVSARPTQGDTALTSSFETFFYAAKGNPSLAHYHSNVFPYSPDPPNLRVHPTQKPVPLMIDILCTFCFPTSRILVPFLGSGNTLLAAHETRMKAVGFDIEDTFKGGFIMNSTHWRQTTRFGKEKEIEE